MGRQRQAPEPQRTGDKTAAEDPIQGADAQRDQRVVLQCRVQGQGHTHGVFGGEDAHHQRQRHPTARQAEAAGLWVVLRCGGRCQPQCGSPHQQRHGGPGRQRPGGIGKGGHHAVHRQRRHHHRHNGDPCQAGAPGEQLRDTHPEQEGEQGEYPGGGVGQDLQQHGELLGKKGVKDLWAVLWLPLHTAASGLRRKPGTRARNAVGACEMQETSSSFTFLRTPFESA